MYDCLHEIAMILPFDKNLFHRSTAKVHLKTSLKVRGHLHIVEWVKYQRWGGKLFEEQKVKGEMMKRDKLDVTLSWKEWDKI